MNPLDVTQASIPSAFLDQLSVGVAGFDLDGRCTLWTRTLEAISGFRAEQVLGRPISEALHFLGEGRPTVMAQNALMGQSLSWHQGASLENFDGIRKRLEIRVSPLTGDSGTIIGGAFEIRDISRHDLRDSDPKSTKDGEGGRFHQLIDKVPVMLWIVRVDGRVDYLSRHCREYLGATTEEDFEDRWDEAVHDDDKASVIQAWFEANKNDMIFENQSRLRRASDGEYRWMLLRAYPMKNELGQTMYWVGAAVDVHQQRTSALRMEQLERFSASLSKAMSSAEIVDIALEQARAASGASFGFIALISNDGKAIEMKGGRGFKTDLFERWKTFPLESRLPIADSCRKGVPFYFSSLDELAKDYPDVIDQMPGVESLALITIPLVAEAKVIGALGIGFHESYEVDEETRQFLNAWSGHCAQALERVRRYELEKSARAEAENERQRLYSILQQIPAMIAITKGPNHIVEFVNPHYMVELYATGDIIGRSILECHPEVVESVLDPIFERVYAEGQPVFHREHPVAYRTAKGEIRTRYFSGALLPLKNEHGSIEGVLAFFLDVTSEVISKRRIEVGEARLNLALEASQVGLWEWDLAADSTWWSAELVTILGLSDSTAAITSERIHSIVHPDDLNGVWDKINEIREAGERFELECRIVRPDGQVLWVLGAGRIYRDGNGDPIRIVGSVLDITQRKASEEALKKAKDAAEAANRAKSFFVANISHEFRTPLTAILGYAEFLGNDQLASEKRSSYVEGIHRNGRSLTKLLEDTLDLAKIEAGRIEVEPGIFDPRALLNDVIGIYSEEAKKKGIHVECSMNGEVPSAVVSDPVRLRQILINLIGNAVKFTSQGSVHIEVLYRTQQEPNSGQIEFRIKDTGIGLNSDQCANIFEPFVQADSATRRRFGGSGLGLFISRQLARALEGDIQLIETKVGRGTVFLLTLNDLSWKLALSPRSVLTPPDQMIQDREQKTLDGARVLVVEDTADIRNLLKAYLMGLGARVHAVCDGIEGVKAAEEAPFDVILMDIQMPVLDGCGAVERIRGMGVKTPIVAVTARAYADEKTRCLELGFDAYLTKPVLFAELESTLRRLIRLKESRAVPPKSS